MWVSVCVGPVNVRGTHMDCPSALKIEATNTKKDIPEKPAIAQTPTDGEVP